MPSVMICKTCGQSFQGSHDCPGLFVKPMTDHSGDATDMTDSTSPASEAVEWVGVPRAPTEAMLKAGGGYVASMVGDPYNSWTHFTGEAEKCWQAMIAAALASPPPQPAPPADALTARMIGTANRLAGRMGAHFVPFSPEGEEQ